jgi:predicted DsbA family dithiol-disulfide isomerase
VRKPITVDVISDVVCPWCFLGKRRLEQAVTLSEIPLTIRWRPFQLDPTIPPEGKDRRAYMEAKFGSLEKIASIHEHITKLGAELGIPFAFDRIKVSPNTLDAHRLIRWAGEANKQEPMVEALFRTYFIEGRDIGDKSVLADIAETAGLVRAEITRRLATDHDQADVRADIVASQRIGVTGVPTYILANRYGLVGAQPAEELARAFEQVAEETAGEAAA